MKQAKSVNSFRSFVNWMMANNESLPEVGKGATVLLWSDRHAYEVMEVSSDKKKVLVQRYSPKRIDNYGMGDVQEYEYKELNGINQKIVWYRGKWRWKGKVVTFIDSFYEQKQVEQGKIVQWSDEEREELWGGQQTLKLVEGKTRLKTEYHPVSIIWGVKQEFYDFTF